MADQTASKRDHNEESTTSLAKPDHGWAAWLHVLACFCLYFNTWGILNTFSVFQAYYSNMDHGLAVHSTPAAISWIGCAQSLLMSATPALVGPLYDQGYLRCILLLGTLLLITAHLALSFCTSLWQMFLTQGIMAGLGGGCLFLPATAMLPQYFQERLGLAVGIATAGSSVGAVVYPVLLREVLERTGFPWAVRAMMFLMLGTLLIPNFVLRYRVKPPRTRNVFDRSSLSEIDYIAFTSTCFLAFAGLFTVWIWLGLFATKFTSEQMAFYIVAVHNAASSFGRIVPNMIADRVGPFNIIIVGSMISGVLLCCMMAVKNMASLVALAVLLGFSGGTLLSLPPLCFVRLTEDKSKLGTRIGMAYAVAGMGVLPGGPGAGSILGHVDPLKWTGVWAFGGVACCSACVGFLAVRIRRYGLPLMQKV